MQGHSPEPHFELRADQPLLPPLTKYLHIHQVDLPHKSLQEASHKKFEDALSLIHSAWQRSDSLCRGRASRDPWC